MRVTRTPAADWPENRRMSLPDTEKPRSWASRATSSAVIASSTCRLRAGSRCTRERKCLNCSNVTPGVRLRRSLWRRRKRRPRSPSARLSVQRPASVGLTLAPRQCWASPVSACTWALWPCTPAPPSASACSRSWRAPKTTPATRKTPSERRAPPHTNRPQPSRRSQVAASRAAFSWPCR